MFYVFPYTVTAADTEAEPYIEYMHLPAGVIHQVDILFQAGCLHKVFVQIWDGDHQLFPTNRGSAIRADSTIISFRDFTELEKGNDRLKAKIWTTLQSTFYETIIQIGILERSVLQPMSFEQLYKAIAGVK